MTEHALPSHGIDQNGECVCGGEAVCLTQIKTMIREWVDDPEGMDGFMGWLTGNAMAWPEFVGPFR